jgi:hypothetical protein
MDDVKISTGPVSMPPMVTPPNVPDTVGGGGELAKQLKKYNQEGKQGRKY